MKLITSAQNPHFKKWKSLLESKGCKKEGLCIVSGRKIVPELLRQYPDFCQEALFLDSRLEEQKACLTLPEGMHSFSLEASLFKELDSFGTQTPLLVMKTPALPDWKESDAGESIEVLAALGEPQNLGALIRSCEAFGVKKLVLLKECVFPFHPKVTRSASGSNFRVHLFKGPSILDLQGPLLALDKDGENIRQFSWPSQSRILIGEEGRGIPSQLKNQTCLSIPMQGQVESLNAVAATSIALYECLSKQKN